MCLHSKKNNMENKKPKKIRSPRTLHGFRDHSIFLSVLHSLHIIYTIEPSQMRASNITDNLLHDAIVAAFQ